MILGNVFEKKKVFDKFYKELIGYKNEIIIVFMNLTFFMFLFEK